MTRRLGLALGLGRCDLQEPLSAFSWIWSTREHDFERGAEPDLALRGDLRATPGAVLAFVIGSLVLGAFAPKKTAGFAAPGLRVLVRAMRRSSQD